MREPLETRAVDILQPDVCGAGGFSEMRRIADMAALHGVRLVPHVWGTGVAIAAGLQFIAALPPDPPRRNSRPPILEFDRTVNPFRQAVLTAPLEHIDGVVTIPDGPGLGIEINRDALARYKLKD
jgi:D-galactarolactone cycloisomerase